MNALPARNWLFPIGYFPIAFVAVVYNQWFIYGHAREQGLADQFHPALLLAAAYLLQSLLSPVSGRVSDSLFSRLGSRKPLMALAAPLLAYFFYRLWLTPTLWEVVAYSFLFMLTTQTYLSLLPRLSTQERHRAMLSVLGSLMAMGATITALTLGPYWVTNYSLTYLGGWGALIVLLGLLVPGLSYRVKTASENQARPHSPERADSAKHVSLRNVIVQSIQQTGYGGFLIANMLIYFASTALTMVSPFFVVSVLKEGEAYVTVMNLSIAAGMIAGVSMLMPLQKRSTPMRIYRSVAIMELLVLLIAAMKLLAVPFFNYIPWVLVFFGSGIFMIATMALPPLIIARYIDQLDTTQDASLFAINGSAINLGSSLAAVAMAVIVVRQEAGQSLVTTQGLTGLGAALGVGLILAIGLLRARN